MRHHRTQSSSCVVKSSRHEHIDTDTKRAVASTWAIDQTLSDLRHLQPTRVGRDTGRIADEVIAHLAGLMGAAVKVVLEIEAHVPRGAPDNVVRTVTENSRTLKFSSHGFEDV